MDIVGDNMTNREDEELEALAMVQQVANMGVKSVKEIGNRLRISEQKCKLLEAENERITGLYEGLKTSFERQSEEMTEKDRKIGQLEEQVRSMSHRQDLFMEMVKSAWEKGLLVIMGERFFSFMKSLKPELFAALSNSLHDSTPEFAPNQHNLLSRLYMQFTTWGQQTSQTLNFNGSVSQVIGHADDVDIK